MLCIVIDTETSGIDAPEVVEVAYAPIDIQGSTLPGATVARFKPSKPITLGALATHHILDEDVAACPPSSDFELPPGIEYIIGHNIDYDWQAIGKPSVKRICTLAMCRSLWPEADSHSLGAMLYLLDRKHAREKLRNAHSAPDDVYNCLFVLRRILEKIQPLVCENFEDLWELSEKMRIPTVMAFGKHKGMKIKDVPSDYKRWYCGTADADPYIVRAMKG